MNWFFKYFKPKRVFDTEKRAARATESILINEALTSDLDDEAASELIQRSLKLAKKIAHGTSRLDDESAQEAMGPRMKAVRKLMRLVNRWGADFVALDPSRKKAVVAEILEQRKRILGEDVAPPAEESIARFLERDEDDPTSFVTDLWRTFFDWKES